MFCVYYNYLCDVCQLFCYVLCMVFLHTLYKINIKSKLYNNREATLPIKKFHLLSFF